MTKRTGPKSGRGEAVADAPGNADARMDAWTQEGAAVRDETSTGPRGGCMAM